MLLMKGQYQWDKHQIPLYLAPGDDLDPPTILMDPNRMLPASAGPSLILLGIPTISPLPALVSLPHLSGLAWVFGYFLKSWLNSCLSQEAFSDNPSLPKIV